MYCLCSAQRALHLASVWGVSLSLCVHAFVYIFINRVHLPCAVRKMRGGVGNSAHESHKKESRMSVTNERVIRDECHELFRLLIREISATGPISLMNERHE